MKGGRPSLSFYSWHSESERNPEQVRTNKGQGIFEFSCVQNLRKFSIQSVTDAKIKRRIRLPEVVATRHKYRNSRKERYIVNSVSGAQNSRLIERKERCNVRSHRNVQRDSAKTDSLHFSKRRGLGGGIQVVVRLISRTKTRSIKDIDLSGGGGKRRRVNSFRQA